jgi:membrane protein implicated in regulation of membrane protease activity
MLTLYVICLIIGGSLVAVSIFAGGDVDVDTDLAGDVDVEAGSEAGSTDGEGVAAAARFLSLRNAVFGAAFFGLTGTLFTVLGVGPLVTPVFAFGTGAIAAMSIHQLMEWLRRSESGVQDDTRSLTGTTASVVVGIDGPHHGKIAVRSGDRVTQLVARPHGTAERTRFEVGEDVVVIRIDNGIAEVARESYLT